MTPLKVTPIQCENCGISSASTESSLLTISFYCVKCGHVTTLKRRLPKLKPNSSDKKKSSKNKNEGESE